MEERRNFFDGRPLSIISNGEGLRLARGDVFAPFIVEEGVWVCCEAVDGEACSSVFCTAVVEAGDEVAAGGGEAFGWVQRARIRRARGVTR